MPEQLEVVWNGSHRDVYLCIPPLALGEAVRGRPGEIPAQPSRRTHTRRDDVRAELRQLIRTKPEWQVSDLADRLRCGKSTLYQLLYQLRSLGAVTSSAYGRVAWAIGATGNRECPITARQRERRLVKRAQGECLECASPTAGQARCDHHRRLHNARRRRAA